MQSDSPTMNSRRILLIALLFPFVDAFGPILGKLVIQDGFDPFTTRLIGNLSALVIIYVFVIIFWRQRLFTGWQVIAMSLLAGSINGIASLIYYAVLNTTDSSAVQFIVGLGYIIFALLLQYETITFDFQSSLQLLLITVTSFLVFGGGNSQIDISVLLALLVYLAFFAGQIIISRKIIETVSVITFITYFTTSSVFVTGVGWMVIQQNNTIPPVDLGQTILLGVQRLLWLGTFFTIIKYRYSLSNWAIGFASLAPYTLPLFIAYFLLGDQLTPVQILSPIMLLTVFVVPYVLRYLKLPYRPSQSTVPNKKQLSEQQSSVALSNSSQVRGDSKPYIFISYSHTDRNYAEKLSDALIKMGVEIWIDGRIDYGARWPHIIQDRLDGCTGIIIIMTPRAYRSDWVQSELQRAKRKDKLIFPFLLEGEEPWLTLESIQYIDVRDGGLPPVRFYDTLRAAGFVET